MADIVQKLRSTLGHLYSEDAADEIERLRIESGRLLAVGMSQADEINKLRADLARCSAAYDRVANTGMDSEYERGAELERLREDLRKSILRERPMTPEEAEAEFDAIGPCEPIPEEQINQIVDSVMERDRVNKTLLPCPFCGHKEIDSRGWASKTKAGPACDWCGATAESVGSWNTRPGDAAKRLASVLDRLRNTVTESAHPDAFYWTLNQVRAAIQIGEGDA